MNKYTVKDLEKAMVYIKNNGESAYVYVEINHLGRLEISASDLSGSRFNIIIYPEDTAKMAEVNKIERL